MCWSRSNVVSSAAISSTIDQHTEQRYVFNCTLINKIVHWNRHRWLTEVTNTYRWIWCKTSNFSVDTTSNSRRRRCSSGGKSLLCDLSRQSSSCCWTDKGYTRCPLERQAVQDDEEFVYIIVGRVYLSGRLSVLIPHKLHLYNCWWVTFAQWWRRKREISLMKGYQPTLSLPLSSSSSFSAIDGWEKRERMLS